jgi:hypothetical protein
LGAKILGVKTVLVGHDATSIFLYLHHAVKGRERNGGKMIASEFGDRSPAQHGTGQMITSFQACLACASGLFGRRVSRSHSESLT